MRGHIFFPKTMRRVSRAPITDNPMHNLQAGFSINPLGERNDGLRDVYQSSAVVRCTIPSDGRLLTLKTRSSSSIDPGSATHGAGRKRLGCVHALIRILVDACDLRAFEIRNMNSSLRSINSFAGYFAVEVLSRVRQIRSKISAPTQVLREGIRLPSLLTEQFAGQALGVMISNRADLEQPGCSRRNG